MRSHIDNLAAEGLARAGLATLAEGSLLRDARGSLGPVLQTLLQRVEAASRPGERDDEHIVCLAIEGGGMRGSVTAGMCVVLEAAGLTRAFDRIYGVSAGALNAWGIAAHQATVSAMHYLDAADARVVDRAGPLRGRPVVDFDRLFGDLIAVRRPLSFEQLAGGPAFRVLATSLETMSLRVLAGFADAGEALAAVRASTFLPRFSGRAPLFRGERMADGSLVEPIPFRAALDEGATHVLVLRSRPAGYRKPTLGVVGEVLAVRDEPALAELIRARHATYNLLAADLETSTHIDGAYVQQVTVPAGSRLVGPLQANSDRVRAALQLGARAMGRTILTEPVELRWLPIVCRSGARAPAAAVADGDPGVAQEIGRSGSARACEGSARARP